MLSDPDDGVPAYVTLHYSTFPFDVADSIMVNGLPAYYVTLADVKVNERVKASLGGLYKMYLTCAIHNGTSKSVEKTISKL